MIERLLPEKGRGFDHMASSSGPELEDAAEESESDEDEGGDKRVPPQPRIGGPMRLRDRWALGPILTGFIVHWKPVPYAAFCKSFRLSCSDREVSYCMMFRSSVIS